MPGIHLSPVASETPFVTTTPVSRLIYNIYTFCSYIYFLSIYLYIFIYSFIKLFIHNASNVSPNYVPHRRRPMRVPRETFETGKGKPHSFLFYFFRFSFRVSANKLFRQVTSCWFRSTEKRTTCSRVAFLLRSEKGIVFWRKKKQRN